MKYLVLVIALIGFSFSGQSQTEKSKTVFIQTSAECGSCKKRLEEKMSYTKGVKYGELHMDNMKLEVKFNPQKISLDEIRKIISETGYDADDVKAIPEAVKKLPACCQPGGMEKMKN